MMNQNVLSLVAGALPQCRRAPDANVPPRELLARLRVTPETELPPMEPLFSMYDVPCFYRGELVAVCGKAKSGKTLLLSMLMAACLTPKVLALERHTDSGQGHTDGTDLSPLRVLWLDTEQSQQSTQDILNKRILPLAQFSPPWEGLGEAFFAYNLRGLGFEKRRQLVDVAIDEVKPDLMVIDGIKDLVTDINDAVQATLIMEQLMALAQQYHCCLVCVLHQNKSEADHNMRGSIGTELTNKAFEVYTCEYIEDCDTFKVAQRLSRRNRIRRKLFYRLDDNGLPAECDELPEQPRDAHGRWVSSKQAAMTGPAVEAARQYDLRKLFTDAMEGRTQRPFGEVMAVALKHCGVVDARTYYACVDMAEQQGIIRKVAHPETGLTWVELVDSQLPF